MVKFIYLQMYFLLSFDEEKGLPTGRRNFDEEKGLPTERRNFDEE